jgi:hypothetical protein
VSDQCRTWNWKVSNETRASIKVEKIVQGWLCSLDELRAEWARCLLIAAPICGGLLVRIFTVCKVAQPLKKDDFAFW